MRTVFLTFCFIIKGETPHPYQHIPFNQGPNAINQDNKAYIYYSVLDILDIV